MTIQLTAAQSAWIESQVAAGRFETPEDALAAAMARLAADVSTDDTWAEPLIAEALNSLDRGEGSPWLKGDTLKAIHAKHPAR